MSTAVIRLNYTTTLQNNNFTKMKSATMPKIEENKALICWLLTLHGYSCYMVTNVTILGVLPQACIQKYLYFFYFVMLLVVKMKRKISGNIPVAKMMSV